MAMKVKKSEQAEEKKPKKKKKGGIIGFLLLIILILALLLLFGDKFGLGLGAGLGLGNIGENSTNEGDSVAAIATADPTESNVPEAKGPMVIEIQGDTIIFASETFSDYGAFEEYFYETADKEQQYILRDNQAIKSVYDSAKALLDSFGATYSEETV